MSAYIKYNELESKMKRKWNLNIYIFSSQLIGCYRHVFIVYRIFVCKWGSFWWNQFIEHVSYRWCCYLCHTNSSSTWHVNIIILGWFYWCELLTSLELFDRWWSCWAFLTSIDWCLFISWTVLKMFWFRKLEV